MSIATIFALTSQPVDVHVDMKKSLLFILLCFLSLHVVAQEDLFGKNLKTLKTQKARKGWILAVNGDVDKPAGDISKLFGYNYRLGPSISYKTKSNWMIGAKFDFMMGNQIKDDSFLANISDQNGNLLDQNGNRYKPQYLERGYLVGVQFGKIFNISKSVQDNGILWMNTIGFMQYKVNIFDKDNNFPQLRGDYKKGYDRLTNGLFIEEYLGYTYFSKDGLLNFHLGLDIAAGFTKCRRDYTYDLMRAQNKQQLDLLFGIRGGWYLPIFKRKSEELIF